MPPTINKYNANRSASSDAAVIERRFVGGIWTSAVAADFTSVRDHGATGDGVTDDTAAIQRAITHLGATYPGTLYFPSGRYQITQKLTLPNVNGLSVVGDGYTSQLIAAGGGGTSLNDDIILVQGAYNHIANLALLGNSANQSAGSGLNIAGAHAWVRDIFATDFKTDGIYVNAASCKLSGIVSLSNVGYGIDVSGSAPDIDILDTILGSNTKDGVRMQAGAGRLTNVHSWGNTLSGVRVESSVTQIHLSNCDLETNLQKGLRLNNNNQGCVLTGGRIWRNHQEGIFGFASTNCSFGNVVIYENGFSTGGAAGISLDSAFDCTITGVNAYDNQSSKTQTYGVATLNTADRNIIVGNVLRAAQHKTGSTSLQGGSNQVANNVT